MKVIVQKWEESERGWGTRPDGYSLHLTMADRDAYVKDIYAKRDPYNVPDEYERVDGTPYEAKVDRKTYDKVAASEHGIRIYSNQYPRDDQGTQGPDGWRSSKT